MLENFEEKILKKKILQVSVKYQKHEFLLKNGMISKIQYIPIDGNFSNFFSEPSSFVLPLTEAIMISDQNQPVFC